MKKIIILLLAISCSNILSQVPDRSKIFSSFNLGILGGINFANIQYTGPSLIIEGKTNITTNLNIKFSFGYSTTFKKDETNVKTYNFISMIISKNIAH